MRRSKFAYAAHNAPLLQKAHISASTRDRFPFDSPSVGNAPVHRFSRRVVKGSTPADASHATTPNLANSFWILARCPHDAQWSYQFIL